jgi:GntR family transcriptional regulator, arabinose operon transcriptional repressor
MASLGQLMDGLQPDRAQPKYEQLCARLIGDVQTGRLKPGDLLPPEPVFAEQLNLARSTVRQALAQMERNGLIRRIRGKGTYIHEEATKRLRSGLDAYALIVPDAQSGYYPSLVAGFEEAAGQVRNQVLLMSTRNDVHRQGDGILQFIDKQVAGAAIVPVMSPATPAYQIRQLQKNKVPVVLCHRGVEGIRAPLLAFSARDVGRLAGEAMAKRGHRRVAFVSALRSGLAEAYEAGFRAAIESAGGTLPAEFVVYIGSDGYADYDAYEHLTDQAIRRLIDRADPPTAIFTGFDATAELIFLLLMRLGVSVPGDMSLVSFGGAKRLSPMQQRLTAVTVDEAAIGRLAVELLDEMRQGKRLIESEERVDIGLGISEGQTLDEV